MNKEKIIMLTIAIFLIIALAFLIIHSNKIENNACKEIGFEKRIRTDDITYCEDSEGNLYYVKMKCSLVSCKAKEISVGRVRTS